MNPIVTLVGNITSAPELKYTPGGKAVVTFTLVTKDSRKDDGGNWNDHDETFYRVTVWERVGEQLVDSDLIPGDPVIVVGKLRNRKYEKDGQTRFSLEVTANEIGVSLRRFGVTAKRAERSASAEGITSTESWGNTPANAQPDEPPF